MGTTLELVYTYRQLLGRCQLGTGLDFDDIEVLLSIEALFTQQTSQENQRLHGERVDLRAVIRNRALHDEVSIVSLSPGGCVAAAAPYADEGDLLEVIFEDDERGLSYRFKARVSWLGDDDNDDFTLGLEFVGTPLLVRYNRSTSGDITEPIAA